MSRPNVTATKLRDLTKEQDRYEFDLQAKYKLVRELTVKMVVMHEAQLQLENELSTIKQCINSCTHTRINILLEEVKSNG